MCARPWLAAAICAAFLGLVCDSAQAQTDEEIEPRIIGQAGTTLVSVAGFIDYISTPEDDLPTNFILQVDGGRFLTRRLFARGGLAGSGSFGTEDATPSGPGAPALHASGGMLFYFTPRSLASAYVGAEYWAQLTRRESGDLGMLLAKGGVQAALSSRSSFFIEGGYGRGLGRREEGDVLTRLTGLVGVRIKL